MFDQSPNLKKPTSEPTSGYTARRNLIIRENAVGQGGDAPARPKIPDRRETRLQMPGDSLRPWLPLPR